MDALAATAYPARPIRIVVASAPGSGPDIVTRLIGRKLAETWQQQIIADNRTGAGGNVGAEIVAHAVPDGYTLLMATASQPIGAALYAKLNHDLTRDFVPVSLIASTPFVLVVNPAVPANSVAELIALAKAKPGFLRYGSGGSGTPPHLCAEILKSSAGLDIVHVPYKGVTPALTDLLGGQVQLVFSVVPSALPLIQTNKLRALGVTSAKRTSLAPELPTIAESLPGFEVIGWYGLLAPTGTPADVVARLNAAVIAALKNPELRERFVALGADPLGTTPQVFAQFIQNELSKWGKAVKDSGARVE
ncbi:MAG TPA: tripartite tricarboxylate transporter substrate binding protein [Burkholderiales bacterium]|nr:tripartite tricarboxylate transporter substrate binding protein [Burkholderiales bacterium]